MMILRCEAFDDASENCKDFRSLMNGNMFEMKKRLKQLKQIDLDAFDLLNKIFVVEEQRYTMKDVINHAYIRNASILEHWKLPNESNYNNTSNKYLILLLILIIAVLVLELKLLADGI